MTRALVGFVLLVAVMALLMSEREKPLLVEATVSNADFTLCLPVNNGPLKPERRDVFHPQESEKV